MNIKEVWYQELYMNTASSEIKLSGFVSWPEAEVHYHAYVGRAALISIPIYVGNRKLAA